MQFKINAKISEHKSLELDIICRGYIKAVNSENVILVIKRS